MDMDRAAQEAFFKRRAESRAKDSIHTHTARLDALEAGLTALRAEVAMLAKLVKEGQAVVERLNRGKA